MKTLRHDLFRAAAAVATILSLVAAPVFAGGDGCHQKASETTKVADSSKAGCTMKAASSCEKGEKATMTLASETSTGSPCASMKASACTKGAKTPQVMAYGMSRWALLAHLGSAQKVSLSDGGCSKSVAKTAACSTMKASMASCHGAKAEKVAERTLAEVEVEAGTATVDGKVALASDNK